jgi:hypothetical protein
MLKGFWMDFIFLFISDELILLVNKKSKKTKLWNKQTMAVKPQKDRYF